MTTFISLENVENVSISLSQIQTIENAIQRIGISQFQRWINTHEERIFSMEKHNGHIVSRDIDGNSLGHIEIPENSEPDHDFHFQEINGIDHDHSNNYEGSSDDYSHIDDPERRDEARFGC